MTTGFSDYRIPLAPLPVGGVLETEITVANSTVDIRVSPTPLMANGQTFNGAIPGPLFKLNKNDTVIVRLKNRLPAPPPTGATNETGIHWHGIELCNYSDGQPFTQSQTVPDPGGAVPLGRSTFLYKFKLPRTGLYWYHPHHHSSMNQVYKGLYGMMIVTDPDEESLVRTAAFPSRPLPAAADTYPLVLSDVTVCKTPPPVPVGAEPNPTSNYATTQPWVGGASLPAQAAPTPVTLCVRFADGGLAVDEMGGLRASFGFGDIPNVQQSAGGQTNEGNMVLTNGVNVGARAGTPSTPGALAAGAHVLPVRRGQGLRLQIVNTATVRYFRLLLTKDDGTKVKLVRVGGEGGLLDRARYEGGIIINAGGNFDTQYTRGEILLPPASRADVVIAIPDTATAGDWTLWTQDFQRTGRFSDNFFSNTASVPVMHLRVDTTLPTESPPYTITGGTDPLNDTLPMVEPADGTPLRASIGGAALVEQLGTLAGGILDPGDFVPPKPGPQDPPTTFPIMPITLTRTGTAAGINAVRGEHDVPYPITPHLDSSRYVKLGDVLEMTVTNTTTAHHPFHLHGFSMQPISLTRPAAGAVPASTYTWNYQEFRDNIDIPPQFTLTFRIKTEDRELADGVTMGGGLGRWMFHCHIFFHAHLGMLGEVVATAANGREKPNVTVKGSWAYMANPGSTWREGTFWHRDNLAVILSSTIRSPTGALVGPGPMPVITSPASPTAAGTWRWDIDTTTPGLLPVQYVYITATDSDGRQDQAVFRLKVGAPDDGADNGDPHIATVDGRYYDFQAVGEFTLLRDTDGFELQARQTPVPTATPIVDANTGLTSCVSINTAVAARVGSHELSYQPRPGKGNQDTLQLYLDKKPVELLARGLDLDGAHVSGRDVGSDHREIQIAYPNGTLVTITPWFWSSYNVWLLNVTVANTPADEGVMGRIPNGTWLPALPNGATVGPKPASAHDRYVALYRTFANAWRVTDATSLFVYGKGTSTATFTDVGWPAEKPPCKLKSELKLRGARPPRVGIDVEKAEKIAKAIKDKALHRNAVFDIATTGDKTVVKAYRLLQDLKLYGTAVQVIGDRPRTGESEAVVFTAIVSGMTRKRPLPTGTVTFFVDGVAATKGVPLKKGRARFKTESLGEGPHWIRAVYKPNRKTCDYRDGKSANLLHTVGEPPKPQEPTPHPHHRPRTRLPVIVGGGAVPKFDAQAQSFDERAGIPEEARIAIARWILDLGKVHKGDKVLEVGAGTGLVGVHLARSLAPDTIPGGAPRYIGFDISPDMLQAFHFRIKEAAVPAAVKLGDANYSWPVHDGSIRVVYGGRVFHLLNAEHVASEALRVAAPRFVTIVVGRIRRQPEGVVARMRHALRQAMKARGHEPRRGDEHVDTLFDALKGMGAKRLEDRVAATWSFRTSPARSLAAWREKEGLGGLDLPAAEQTAILREVEKWAANEFGDLDREETSEAQFVLQAVRLKSRSGAAHR